MPDHRVSLPEDIRSVSRQMRAPPARSERVGASVRGLRRLAS